MAKIIDQCQTLVDEHFDSESASPEQWDNLMPNPVIAPDGKVKQKGKPILPDSVLRRLYDLSYEFMNYPDDIGRLGSECYRQYIERDGAE